MDQDRDQAQCPVCDTKLTATPRVHQKFDAHVYDCPQCGKYVLEGLAAISEELKESKQLVSAWIRRQNRHGNIPFIGVNFFKEDWFKNLRSMGLPQTIYEKLDELLKAYADIDTVKSNYVAVVKSGQHPSLIADIAGSSHQEVMALNQLLEELGYVRSELSHPNDHVRLTAKGWQRIGELSQPTIVSDVAFIAMWYDSRLDDYRKCAERAVAECGYKPIVIGAVAFNDFIMNEVIRFIRQSRFLIADLTCSPEGASGDGAKVVGGVRGGVYWEAGMAYGLGKTVILTCRDDDHSRKRVHFDLEQYQTVFWRDEELIPEIRPLSGHLSAPNLAERLALRILATLGKGSYPGSD